MLELLITREQSSINLPDLLNENNIALNKYKNKSFKILAIDEGGIKIIYPLLFLNKLIEFIKKEKKINNDDDIKLAE